MTGDPTARQRLEAVFARPASGIVELVDRLALDLREHRLQFEWQAGCCLARIDDEEAVTLPLRKSLFRAMLARIAALCNERDPNAVSPYGGEGEFAVGSDASTLMRVAFVNTPERQRLEMTPIQHRAVEHSPSTDQPTMKDDESTQGPSRPWSSDPSGPSERPKGHRR